MDHSQIVLHYAFFVQQEWLDRTHLLEDVRMANLPETVSSRSIQGYVVPRLIRILCQIPSVISRKVKERYNEARNRRT